MASAYADAVGYVDVSCPTCGDVRQVTDRQFRRAKADGSKFECNTCRTANKNIEVTDTHRKYWLDRYPIEWIRDVGQGIWGKSW